MKKRWLALLLSLICIVMLGYYVLDQRHYFGENPLQPNVKIQSLSFSTQDAAGNIYVIDRSMKRVLKIAPDGTLLYEIDVDQRTPRGFYLTTELAVDHQGNLYTLNIRLDGQGIRIESEDIVRYSPTGKYEGQVYALEYPVGERPTRPGKLRDLSVENGVVSIYRFEDRSLTLGQIEIDENLTSQGSLREKFSFTLGDDLYLFELTGTDPGAIFFTTLRGELYRIESTGEPVLIYAGGVKRDQGISFPVMLDVSADGELFFVDRGQREVRRISQAIRVKPENVSLSTVLADAQLQNENFSISLLSVSSLTEVAGQVVLSAGDSVLLLDETGQIAKVVEKARYGAVQYLHKLSVWLAALILSALFVYFCRLIYVDFMGRRVSLIVKQAIVFVPLVMIAMVIVASIVYQGFSDRFEAQVFDNLKMLVHVSTPTLDVERIERIQQPEDYMNDDFRRLNEHNQTFLRGMSDENDALYSVLYKVDEGQLYVLMLYNTTVGTYYPHPMRDIYADVISSGEVLTMTDPDVDGEWMYAIGPVYNDRGELIALHEIGMTSRNFDQYRRELFWRTGKLIVLITPIIIAVLVLMTYLLLSSIRRLRRSVNEIASGNWGTTVSINTRDEVEDLGHRFNLMSKHIQDYISKVNQLNQAYYRFVPQQFLEFLGKKSILDVHLGDQVEQEISVLVCNVRSFYEISAELKPAESFNLINTFLKSAGPIIRRKEGFINHYLGAGILALFPKKPEHAIQSAVDLLKMMRRFNQAKMKRQEQGLKIGIGIHKGPLMIGIVGEEERLEGAVISDHVNLASVLEQLTETFGSNILVSTHTFHAVKDHNLFEHRCLGRLQTSENSEPIEIYDIFEADEQEILEKKKLTKVLFEQAVSYYQEGRFFDARTAFVQIIRRNPADKMAKIYFHLCDEYFQSGAPTGWNGTLRLYSGSPEIIDLTAEGS